MWSSACTCPSCPCRRFTCPSGRSGGAVVSLFPGGVRGGVACPLDTAYYLYSTPRPGVVGGQLGTNAGRWGTPGGAGDARAGHGAPRCPPALTGGETLSKASKISHNESNGCGMSPAPVFTLGLLALMNTPPAPAAAADRYRISVDLSAVVSSHLDHISEITGQSKSAIVAASFLDALPALLARADALKKRQLELATSQKDKK